MKSRRVYLKSLTVCLIIISITQTTQSLDSSETLRDHTSPVDYHQLISSRPYTIRGKTINYEVNVSKVFDKIQNAQKPLPLASSASSQRRHVGRVSRKQYEIVNMLWRRTNVFIDEDNITPTIQNHPHDQSQKPIIDFCEVCRQYSTSTQSPSILTTVQPYLPTKTPSYIEFYYLVEMDNEPTTNYTVKGHVSDSKKNYRAENEKCNELGNKGDEVVNHEKRIIENNIYNRENTDNNHNQSGGFSSNVSNYQTPIPRNSYWMFENDIPAYITSNTQVRQKFNTTKPSAKDTLPGASITNSSLNTTYIKDIDRSTTQSFENSKNVLERLTSSVTAPHINSKDIVPENVTNVYSTTKPYDKIKFFEVYDSDTEGSIVNSDKIMNPDVENDINVDQKIDLEHIDQELRKTTSQKPKIIKKHIDDSKSENSRQETTAVNLKLSLNFSVTAVPTMFLNITSKNKLLNSISSRTALWSEYPFAAVYVYERFQVHCDAGVISPHWLLASGFCLSRHREDPVGDRRSAFVTYCGDSWWDPERINYVKYSIIHPRFSPRDRARRHLYNIGLIKVVTSMASACNNWAAISLISHQYTANQDGSMASAIGWGLDRFDTRYSTAELPRHPLSVYNSLVFSDTCPGNVGYRRAKHRNEEGIRNVYCLALPQYSGEDDDPIHGGLLLVGGNLIALYLQEERRQWGEQSAQYTGIWRLVPWITDTAREPDEADFMF